MKAFLPVVYILTVATLVYTADLHTLRQLYSGIVNCADSLDLPREPSPYVIRCMMYQVNLIDQDGKIIRSETLDYLRNIISNEYNLRQAQDIVAACIDYVDETGGHDDHENTIKIIECSLPVIGLILAN